MRRFRVLGLLVVGALGCESIAGIEDRTFEAPITGSAECEAYCNDVMTACSGQFAAYLSRASCVRTCDAFPRGEASQQNTVECRAQKANIAVTTKEPASDCPAAGPFGIGACGSTCDAYCSLLAELCPEEASAVTNCNASCEALLVSKVYDLSKLATGDTLECRIHHLSFAALDPKECSNAAVLPRPGNACSDPADSAPECEDYCRVSRVACSGGLSVYENEAQCLATCKALPVGIIGHTTENSVGCRLYHSYSAVANPAGHCSHAGPLGDGHCGLDQGAVFGNCESYCAVLEAGCKADFSGKFASQSDCIKDCASLNGAAKDQGYDVTSAGSGDSVQCRTLHASRAFGDAGQCAAAMGAAPCN